MIRQNTKKLKLASKLASTIVFFDFLMPLWFDNPDIIYIRPQNNLIPLSIIIARETTLASNIADSHDCNNLR